ncbi:uncharacterized protein [Amphiura filiformis]|uniref:uncharacterized protein n=1 Tax=Amphiura filiformis TaxID=82378 RepID=UPI003B2278EC
MPLIQKYLYQETQRVCYDSPGQLRIKNKEDKSPGEMFTNIQLLEVTRLVGHDVTSCQEFDAVNDCNGKLRRIKSKIKYREDEQDCYGIIEICALINDKDPICIVQKMAEVDSTSDFPHFTITDEQLAISTSMILGCPCFVHKCTTFCTVRPLYHDLINSNIMILNTYYLGN